MGILRSAQSLVQRTRELAIRGALGAQPADILKWTLMRRILSGVLTRDQVRLRRRVGVSAADRIH